MRCQILLADLLGEECGALQSHRGEHLIGELHPVLDAIESVAFPKLPAIVQQTGFLVPKDFPERKFSGDFYLVPMLLNKIEVLGPVVIGLDR